MAQKVATEQASAGSADERAEAAVSRLRVAARDIEARPWRLGVVLDEVAARCVKARAGGGA